MAHIFASLDSCRGTHRGFFATKSGGAQTKKAAEKAGRKSNLPPPLRQEHRPLSFPLSLSLQCWVTWVTCFIIILAFAIASRAPVHYLRLLLRCPIITLDLLSSLLPCFFPSLSVMLFSEPLLRHRQSLSHYFHAGLVQYLRKSFALQNGSQTHLHLVQEAKDRAFRTANSEQALSEDDLRLQRRPEERPENGDPAHVYGEDDSLWTVACSVVKIVTCFSAMLLTTIFWTFIMLLLLPFPYARIKQGNIYGHVTGRMLMWILGNPIKIYGRENSNLNAIYICNHASPLDIFLVMWLTPTGTVGIAKKEIIWYPLFGQLYVLANHLRIDRTNSGSSIQSLRKIAKAVVDKNLSVIVFPEGTRSATGRLLAFKKGFVHLAIQTKRPIVPMVLTGTHLGWQKNSLRVRPAPLTVTYLSPIKTDEWTTDNVDKYVDMLHALYVKHLPPSQKPLGMVADKAQS